MNYEEMIKKVASTNKTATERGEIIIKEMARVINDILDYKYVSDHHKGNKLNDKAMEIKNSVAVLESDMDVFKEVLGIADKVDQKKEERMKKIVNRLP